MKAPALEVAEVMRAYGREYMQLYGDHMPAVHRKAMADMLDCRTPAMGGTTYHCPGCDHYHYSYHSCGNRNCNKCGNQRTQQWLGQTGTLLLPVDHFMVTFTLPGELRRLARSHQKLFYGLLMKCAAASLQTLGWDSRYVGGQLAMMGVLHTWGRDLSYHPHVHMIVAGGGLWANEGLHLRQGCAGQVWLAARPDFLMPVKALSLIFSAKFRDALKKADPPLFASVHKPIWKQPWVVHSQSVGSGQAALKYLAQYVFRPAISNKRLVSMAAGKVTFRWQHAQTNQWKTTTLDAIEFIRRYLQHVLLRGFVKVRYYGLYAHRHRGQLSRLCDTMKTTASDGIIPSSEQVDTLSPEAPSAKPVTCCHCGQSMFVVGTIPRSRHLSEWPHAPPAGSANHTGYRNHGLSILQNVPVNHQ